MDNLIAKRYANAILTQKNADEFYELLSTLVGAFSLEKFKAILNSSQISKDEKLKFISSCFDKGKPNFMNFLKILAQNSRLNLIPQIAQELGRQKALKAQIYEGVVHSPKALHKKELDELIADGGTELSCQFCDKKYKFSASDLRGLLNKIENTKEG